MRWKLLALIGALLALVVPFLGGCAVTGDGTLVLFEVGPTGVVKVVYHVDASAGITTPLNSKPFYLLRWDFNKADVGPTVTNAQRLERTVKDG